MSFVIIKVIFCSTSCMIIDDKNTCIFFKFKENNVYIIDLRNFDCNVKYFLTLKEDSWLWHKRHGHISFDHLADISSKNAVRGILKLKFEKYCHVMHANMVNKLNRLLNQLRML